MFGIGMPELLIILVIILIIFGVGKLPQIGSALGKGLRNFKTSVSDNSDNSKEPDKIEDEKKSPPQCRKFKVSVCNPLT
jgi:sec-independent protein translocase protein TatA